MRFIGEHKDRAEGGLRWGVESICEVLREQGCLIAPSTYYDAIGRGPSRRARRDELLKPVIARVHAPSALRGRRAISGHSRVVRTRL